MVIQNEIIEKKRTINGNNLRLANKAKGLDKLHNAIVNDDLNLLKSFFK